MNLRWFKVVALAVPVCGLVLLELLLRVLGVGYPTEFFLQTRKDGRAVFIENQQFSRRYFPPGLERTPQPVLFAAEKPANTLRIFVLGESAAMGDPEPAFGFPRMLEVLLREALPGRRIEVINAAVTAINSHVIREIAKDCADKQGDYWLLYMGNNEVVGPFGAGTVFGDQAPSLSMVRANVALKSLRLGQVVDALRLKIGGGPGAPSTWEGMEMFLNQQVSLDDPRLSRVQDHFEANLRDIVRYGQRAGAKVLVSSVAVNLKDCAPFASRHRKGLTEADTTRWNSEVGAGDVLEKEGKPAAALEAYERAAKVDDLHAELSFRLGRCCAALGKLDDARKHFERARDLDALRFRADAGLLQRTTNALLSAGAKLAVDALALVATNCAQGLPGEELFFEHVHFNFAGNYLLARSFAERILAEEKVTGTVIDSTECERRLALTDFNRHRVLDEVRERLRQPPFNRQLGHREREERLAAALAKLDRASLTNAVAIYTQALARSPEDAVLHENFATLLQDFGREEEALGHWRRVVELLPHNEQGWFGLANLLDATGRSGDAIPMFREALLRRPNSPEARSGLALALSNAGRTAEAIAEYEKVIRATPGFVEARINLGLTLAAQGRHQEAAAQYMEVIRRQSNNVPARINLGKLFALEGKPAEAVPWYREALVLRPENAVAHYNLGNALNALSQFDEATRHFGEAVRLRPEFAEARYNLALGLARQKREMEALEQFAEAVRLKPSMAEGRFNYGVALAKARRLPEAIEQFRETLRLDPGNAAAKKFLDQALSMQ